MTSGERIGDSSARARIAFVVSAPLTAEAFLCDHIAALSERFEVHLIANADPRAITHPALQRARRHRVGIVRTISPWSDMRAIAGLTVLLRREGYAAVHSLTPKAGLVTAIAAFFARVPVRIHTFTGQVWATRAGARRAALKKIDRLIAALDTHILVDSLSQRDFLRAERVLAPTQGVVLAHGSVAGVDASRFRPDPVKRASVRARLGIAGDAIVFLFVGRLTREKGVLELAHAFAQIAAERPDAVLLVVGPDEEGLGAAMRHACGPAAGRLVLAAQTAEPESYMAASDVFCLPSYREGFGSVIIEAAAVGLPAIGSRIYGVTDAIDEGRTGLLVDPQEATSLAGAMRDLAADTALRARLAYAARERALSDFSSSAISRALVDFYAAALARTSGLRSQA